MAKTHNNNDGENNNARNPPSPTIEQVLMMQAQMLQTMQQTMVISRSFLITPTMTLL
jgi:hypothetical protein